MMGLGMVGKVTELILEFRPIFGVGRFGLRR